MNEVRISVFDAIDSAFHKMKQVLFAPFDLEKWLTVGFCAFLAALAQGGGVGYGGRWPGSGPSHRAGFDRLTEWVGAHMTLVLTVGAFALLAVFALGALLQWLGSRGQFMFLDNVARDRGAVADPWNRYRRQGNSLFLLRFLVGLCFTVVVILVVALALVFVWGPIRLHQMTAGAVAVLVAAALVVVPLALALALFNAVLKDFVVPVMARRELSAVQALRVFWRELLPGHVGVFVVYYLMAFIFGIATATLVTIGTCVTCCIAGLPYVSSVVFLPIWVFFRAFSLCLLAQFGPEWDLFREEPPRSGPAAEPPGTALPPAGLPPGAPGPGPNVEPVGQEGVPPREDEGLPVIPE